jgi:hypothetical protein
VRITTWTGAALAAAGICALSACGGGSSHAAAPLPAATSTPGANNPTVSGTSRVTLTIHRAKAATASAARVPRFNPPPAPADVAANPRRMAGRNAMLAHFAAHLKTLAAGSVRSPKLFSTYAKGLIFTVAATGTTISQTLYADISSTSPLCTTTNNVSTCTLNVPNIATTETLTAIETDATPTGENTTTGYGTGPSTVSILGGVSASETVTPGGALALTMSPAVSQILDSDGTINPPSTNVGFGFYLAANQGGNHYHITLQNGTPESGMGIIVALRDADTDDFLGVSGVPLVDMNGTPTAVSFTSLGAGITLFAQPDGNLTYAAPSYAAVTPISDSGAQDYSPYGDYNAIVDVNYDGTPFTTTSIVASNNFTATAPPYAFGSQQTSPSWLVTSMGTDVTTASVPVGGSTIINAVDPQSPDGADAYDGDIFTEDFLCIDNGGNALATVDKGTYDATTGYQPFTITGQAAGQCTLYFVDADSFVAARPVTVTVQ